MNKLAPHITRQRLLIEGFYDREVDEKTIRDYFKIVTGQLELRTYGDPIIFSPGGEGKAENQGYDAFVPLIDSGISLYVWTGEKFFSAVLYTCKAFNASTAVQVTKDFFKAAEVETQEF